MEISITILGSLVIGFFGAITTQFWRLIIGSPDSEGVVQGMLLSALGGWIWEQYLKHEQRQDRIENLRLHKKRLRYKPTGMTLERYEVKLTRAALERIPNPYKPMGICGVCTQPYFTAIIFVLFYVLAGGLNFWGIFISILYGSYLMITFVKVN